MDQLTGRQLHCHVSVRTSVRQMPQAGIPTHAVTENGSDRMHPRVLHWKVLALRDAGLAALQPPCAPLGLPASLLPPSYAVGLEGIVSGWPHYFPLNQPKEGLSQAQRGLLQQGRAVTHLQHSALALSATILPRSRKITYWHIFLNFHTEAFEGIVEDDNKTKLGCHVYCYLGKTNHGRSS